QGAKVLWYNQLLSYEWWGRERPIVKPEDAKGLRLRSLGGIYDNFYAAIGGSTVNVPAGEQYSAFQRGIADGMVIDFGTVESRKLYEVLKYGTKGLRLRPGANAITINLDVWKSLPKDTQDAFLAAAREASSREVDRVVPLYDELANFLESKGMQLHQATEAERKAWFAYGKMVEDDYLKISGDLGRKVMEAARKYQ
ncbi:MAG: TRAP transporter substrate-binding protein DctP, partial [Chloroflexi bacterium]|nr:TRAP transporter substrate-binding protein DctP [Chloroflexota bacterium]